MPTPTNTGFYQSLTAPPTGGSGGASGFYGSSPSQPAATNAAGGPVGAPIRPAGPVGAPQPPQPPAPIVNGNRPYMDPSRGIYIGQLPSPRRGGSPWSPYIPGNNLRR